MPRSTPVPLRQVIFRLWQEGRGASRMSTAGLRGLNDGQKVTYDVVMERGKAAATNLKVA